MSKFQISLLITTVNEGIFRVKKNFLHLASEKIEIIISHQISNKKFLQKFTSKNVIYLPRIGEKWLSKNRNHAIKKATGDICYICDDDLVLNNDFYEKIITAYQDIDADIITFDAMDFHGNLAYNIKEWIYNLRKILNIFSWGITFRREKILAKKILFDEDFWINAKYPIAEENIFIADAKRRGLRIFHHKKIIASHFSKSSGFFYNDIMIIARIQAYKRIGGILLAIICAFSLTFKHYHLYKNHYSWPRFLYKNIFAIFYHS